MAKMFVAYVNKPPVVSTISIHYDEKRTETPRFFRKTNTKGCFLKSGDMIKSDPNLGLVGQACNELCNFAQLDIENGGCAAVNREAL